MATQCHFLALSPEGNAVQEVQVSALHMIHHLRLLGAQDIGAVVERAAQANLLTAAAKRVLLDRQATRQVQDVGKSAFLQQR